MLVFFVADEGRGEGGKTNQFPPESLSSPLKPYGGWRRAHGESAHFFSRVIGTQFSSFARTCKRVWRFKKWALKLSELALINIWFARREVYVYKWRRVAPLDDGDRFASGLRWWSRHAGRAAHAPMLPAQVWAPPPPPPANGSGHGLFVAQGGCASFAPWTFLSRISRLGAIGTLANVHLGLRRSCRRRAR